MHNRTVKKIKDEFLYVRSDTTDNVLWSREWLKL